MMWTSATRSRLSEQVLRPSKASTADRGMRFRASRYGRGRLLRLTVKFVIVFGSVALLYAHFRLHWKLPSPNANVQSSISTSDGKNPSPPLQPVETNSDSRHGVIVAKDVKPLPNGPGKDVKWQPEQPKVTSTQLGHQAPDKPGPVLGAQAGMPINAAIGGDGNVINAVNLRLNQQEQRPQIQQQIPGFGGQLEWGIGHNAGVGNRPPGGPDVGPVPASGAMSKSDKKTGGEEEENYDEDYEDEDDEDEGGDEDERDEAEGDEDEGGDEAEAGQAEDEENGEDYEENEEDYEDYDEDYEGDEDAEQDEKPNERRTKVKKKNRENLETKKKRKTADNKDEDYDDDEEYLEDVKKAEQEYKELLEEYEKNGGVDDDEEYEEEDKDYVKSKRKRKTGSRARSNSKRKSAKRQPGAAADSGAEAAPKISTTTKKPAVAAAAVVKRNSPQRVDDDFESSLVCDIECKRFRINLATWPADKPKAVIYYLIHRAALNSLGRSIKSLERHFNRQFQYPIVVFVEPELDTESDRKLIRGMINGRDDIYVQVVRFQIPSYVNASAVPKMAGFGKRKRTIGYRHMCRFHAGGVYRQPIMLTEGLQFGWRLDDDSMLAGPIKHDLFRFMRDEKLQYGYRKINTGWSPVDNGLWDAVERYVQDTDAKSKIPGSGIVSLRTPMYRKWPKNAARYFNNFEISSLDVWRSSGYRDYFNFVDRLGGIYYYKWGDAAIKTIAVTLFIPEDRTHLFKIRYRHV